MRLELLIRPIRRPIAKLIAVQLEYQIPQPVSLPAAVAAFPSTVLSVLSVRASQRRHLEPEERVLLRQGLDLVRPRHDDEDELRVAHDDAPHADPAHAPTAHDLQLRAVEVRTREPRHSGAFDRPAAAVREDLLHVPYPEPVQRLVEGVPALRLGDVVDAQGALLARGERLGLELLPSPGQLGAAQQPLVARVAAGLGGLQEEGAVLDLLGEDAGRGGGGVGAGEERLGDAAVGFGGHGLADRDCLLSCAGAESLEVERK